MVTQPDYFYERDASLNRRTNIIICRIVRIVLDDYTGSPICASVGRVVIGFRTLGLERRASCHPREMLFTPLTRLVSFGGAPRLLALRISST